MTFLSAIVVVMLTAMMVGPKWIDSWRAWKESQQKIQVNTAAPAGQIDKKTLHPSTNRRLWQVSGFWGMVMDLLFGFGALTLLFVLTTSDEPATVGRVAWCVMLGGIWVVSSLRRWR